MDFYKPKGITFIPTYECTTYCPHCNVDYNKIKNFPKMDIGLAIDILNQAHKMGINGVQFSGGEPTLHPEFIIEITKRAKALSMKMHRPATNGALGSSIDTADSFFKMLKESGYNSGFRLSIDKYHCRNGVRNQANFVSIFGKYFPFRNLSIGCCAKDRNSSSQFILKFLEELNSHNIESSYKPLDEYLYIKGEKVKIGYWAPTRPTWKNLPDEEFNLKTIPTNMSGCLGEKGVGYLWIEPDGNLRICCGNANLFIDYLMVGNLKKEKLSDLIRKINSNKIFQILSKEGPAGLRRVIRERRPELLPLEKTYTHKCELCWEIFTSPKTKDILFSK